jgi:hypothetical protein
VFNLRAAYSKKSQDFFIPSKVTACAAVAINYLLIECLQGMQNITWNFSFLFTAYTGK